MDKTRILMVDDEAGTLETLRDVLTDMDYHVEVATDGARVLTADTRAGARSHCTLCLHLPVQAIRHGQSDSPHSRGEARLYFKGGESPC